MEKQDVLVVCEHAETGDRAGRCYKCGHEMPPTMDRDPAFERAVLNNAAEAVGLSHVADSLHAFADKRAEPGPVRLWEGRDLLREWLEEIADGVGNYGPWEIQRRMIEGLEDDGKDAYIQEALRHGLLMYAALRKAYAE